MSGTPDDPADIVTIIWKGSIMAAIFALPPLGVFFAIYLGTGSLIAGAVVGFGMHFVILAFSGRISKLLVDRGTEEG